MLPNPSGLNASFPGFKHKLVWFERLREFIESHATLIFSNVTAARHTPICFQRAQCIPDRLARADTV